MTARLHSVTILFPNRSIMAELIPVTVVPRPTSFVLKNPDDADSLRWYQAEKGFGPSNAYVVKLTGTTYSVYVCVGEKWWCLSIGEENDKLSACLVGLYMILVSGAETVVVECVEADVEIVKRTFAAMPLPCKTAHIRVVAA